MSAARVSIPDLVALATADTSEPCTNGHHDCATAEGGPCSAEAAAWLFSHGVDIDAECWQEPRTGPCAYCGHPLAWHATDCDTGRVLCGCEPTR